MKNKVYLYIFDTMADWEFGYLNAELQSGRYFKEGATPLKIVTMGNSKEPITTMGGLRVIPDITIDEFNMDNAAVLILSGGNTWSDKIHDSILSLAEKCLENSIVVAAICGATIALARVGLLDKRYHTSNNLKYLKMACPNYTGESYYKQELAVNDNNLITASGIAPLEFAMEVFKKLDTFSPAVLEAWYQLYKTQNPKFYLDLVNKN